MKANLKRKSLHPVRQNHKATKKPSTSFSVRPPNYLTNKVVCPRHSVPSQATIPVRFVARQSHTSLSGDIIAPFRYPTVQPALSGDIIAPFRYPAVQPALSGDIIVPFRYPTVQPALSGDIIAPFRYPAVQPALSGDIIVPFRYPTGHFEYILSNSDFENILKRACQ